MKQIAVIFDMDGLLVDSETVSAKAFKETAADYQLHDAFDLFMSLVGCNEKQHVITLKDALEPEIDSTKFRQDWIARYQAAIQAGVPPLLPGAKALLQWLNENNIKRALATSSGRAAAEKKLEGNNIFHYFETITTGDDVQISKPNPEIFLKATASIGVYPEQALVLEDSENGVRAGVGAGMRVIQVPNLVPPSQELLKLGHEVCESLNTVLALLKKESLPNT